MQLPDLSRYRLHRMVADAEFEGTAVPGLRAEFFRCELGRDGRWEPAGPGCPTVRVLRDGDRVTGFQVRHRHGQWLGTAAAQVA